MSKFVFIYRGGASGSTPEEQDKIMAAWGKWFEDLGEALIDGGNPFGPSKEVTSEGVHDSTNSSPATGYSIVKAASQSEAAELAKGCPMFVNSADGIVEVYEAFPM